MRRSFYLCILRGLTEGSVTTDPEKLRLSEQLGFPILSSFFLRFRGIKTPIVIILSMKAFFFLKRFDRGACNRGLVVSKSKGEGEQDKRKTAVPVMNLVSLG
jgi:hypothetical protein